MGLSTYLLTSKKFRREKQHRTNNYVNLVGNSHTSCLTVGTSEAWTTETSWSAILVLAALGVVSAGTLATRA
jgi:hypothetical protein